MAEYNILALGDVHAPYHDKEALGIALQEGCEWLKGKKNPYLVLIGDTLDCESLSSYSKSPDRYSLWLEELQQCKPVLMAINAMAKSVKAKVVWTLGNHENRLQRQLCDFLRPVYGMHTIESDLEIEDWGWEVVPYQEPYYVGNCMFVHDQGSHGTTALKKLMQGFPTHNVFMGHVHRADTLRTKVDGNSRVGQTLGWLGMEEHAKYLAEAQRMDWQVGYTTITAGDTGPADVHFYGIHGET